MRKILTSVLSVAGLLAVVLALATSPASAAKEVVTVTSAEHAGTYTVTFETKGSCDPGSGTSGASGSVTLTVVDADGANTTVESGIVIDTICQYEYKFSFVNAAGATCSVARQDAQDDVVDTITITGGDDCTTPADVVVTIEAAGTNVGDCIDDTADPATPNDDCDTDGEDGDEANTRRATADDVTDPLSAGAISKTSFTVTATAAGDDPDEGCVGDSDDSETGEDGNNTVTLTVVDSTAGKDDNCTYDITAALATGFAASTKGSNVATVNTEVGDDVTNTRTFTVAVATRNVHLVQNVIGDAGDASATYEMADLGECRAPDLPPALLPRTLTGGIMNVGGETVVELRSNLRRLVTGAINDTDPVDSEQAVAGHALDTAGNACHASVSVSGAPAHCTVQSNSPVNLAESDNELVVIEFTIDCSAPVEPVEVAPVDDDTDDTVDGGADEMTGGADEMTGDTDDTDDGDTDDTVDGGADEMTGGADEMTGDTDDTDDGDTDDTDDGDTDDTVDGGADDTDDGMDDVGPPEDIATG